MRTNSTPTPRAAVRPEDPQAQRLAQPRQAQPPQAGTVAGPSGSTPAAVRRDPDEPRPKRPHVDTERQRGLRLMGAGAHDTEVDAAGDSRVRPLQSAVNRCVAYELYEGLFAPTAKALHGMLADFERVNIGLHDCLCSTPQGTLNAVAHRWFNLPDELKATGEYKVNVELALGLGVGPNRSELHDELEALLDRKPGWRQAVANLLHAGAQLGQVPRAAAGGPVGAGAGASGSGGAGRAQPAATPVVHPPTGPAAGPSVSLGPVAPDVGGADLIGAFDTARYARPSTPTNEASQGGSGPARAPASPSFSHSLPLSQIDGSELIAAWASRAQAAGSSSPEVSSSQPGPATVTPAATAGPSHRAPASPSFSYSLPLSQIDASAVIAADARQAQAAGPSSPAVTSRQPGPATVTPAATAGPSQPVSTLPGSPPASLRQAGVRQPVLGILERAVEQGGLSPADVQALIAGGDTASLVHALRYLVPNLMKPISDSEATSASSVPAQPVQPALSQPARPSVQPSVQQPAPRTAAGAAASGSTPPAGVVPAAAAAAGSTAAAAAAAPAAEVADADADADDDHAGAIVIPPPPLPPVHLPPLPMSGGRTP